jgi:isocitrate dehydrogenase
LKFETHDRPLDGRAMGVGNTIAARQATYDLARRTEDAVVTCRSGFDDAITARIEAG